MAKILDIKCDTKKLPRYKVYFYMENSTVAEYYYNTCLFYVRSKCRALNLYCEDNALVLDGPIVDGNGNINALKKKKVEEVACKLKNIIENDIS